MIKLFKRKSDLNVVVLGNCQARPLAQKLSSMSKRLHVSAVGIVHLLNDDNYHKYEKHFRKADWIFAQRVVENYPCDFVRNKALKDKWGKKVVVWPNIYYRGYNPELIYVRLNNRKPLQGPLGDYHNRTIIDSWRQGFSQEETVNRHLDIALNRQAYGSIPEKSLSELRVREKECDIQLAEYISERINVKRLFFTFNHPIAELISLCAKKLIALTELTSDIVLLPEEFEPLGKFCPPINPWVASTIDLSYQENDEWHGVDASNISGNNVQLGEKKIYDSSQIVDIFYRIYNANKDAIGDWFAGAH